MQVQAEWLQRCSSRRLTLHRAQGIVEKTNLNPNEVGGIVVGTVLAPSSQRAIECRMAAFYAGFPEIVPLRTINWQCSSGLQAIADVIAAIEAGFYDVGIGAGVDCNGPGWDGSINLKAKAFQEAQDCLLPMGITSKYVAHRFGVTQREQDQAAVESHKKAAAAIATGKFKDEIIHVTTKIIDPKSGDKKVPISMDDGIRPKTSITGLAKLKPAFKKDGSTNVGNSSQVSDGVGAILLMRKDVAEMVPNSWNIQEFCCCWSGTCCNQYWSCCCNPCRCKICWSSDR